MRRKKILKMVAWLTAAFLLLIVFFVFAIQFAPVQSSLVNRITRYLSAELHTKVTIGSVDFNFFKTFSFNQVYIEDEKGDTLLFADKLNAEISLLSFGSRQIVISSVTVGNGLFNLKRFKERKGLNLDIITDYFSSNDTNKTNRPWKLDLKKVKIDNLAFRYRDYRWDDETPLIDFEDIKVDSLHAELVDFYLHDSVYFRANNISFKEKKGFVIHHLETNVSITQGHLYCNELNIRSAQSDIHGGITFLFNEWEDFEDFISKVQLKTSFTSSKLSSIDLAFFARELRGLNKVITVQGDIAGTIDRLRGRKMKINYGRQCVMEGDIGISGLPDIEESYIDANFTRLVLDQKEIQTIPEYPFYEERKIEIPEWLTLAGDVKFKGRFTGFIYDFVTYGTIQTDLGDIITDINLKVDSLHQTYSGSLTAVNFDLGVFTSTSDVLGRATFNCDIKGKYFDLNKMTAEVEGKVDKFQFKGYEYSNIDVKGSIAKKLFNGFLSVNEENIAMVFDGKVDFNGATPLYDFQADIDHLRPYALKLIKGEGVDEFSGKIKTDLAGNNIDNINGSIFLNDITYTQGSRFMEIDSLTFVSEKAGGSYNVILRSDMADARFMNVKKISTIYYAIWNTLTAYVPSLKPYDKKVNDEVCQFEAIVKNLDPAFQIFYPALHIEPGTELLGDINTFSKHINIAMVSSLITWRDIRAENLQLSGNDVNGRFTFKTEINNFVLSEDVPIDKVSVTGSSNNSEANILIAIHDVDTATNKLVLAFNSQFGEEGITNIQLQPVSVIKVDSVLWKFSNDNNILYDDNGWTFTNMNLSSNYNNAINVKGNTHNMGGEPLRFKFTDFNVLPLNKLLVLYDLQFGGIVNGNLDFMALQNKPLINGDLFIRNFSFFQDSIGDAHVISQFNSNKDNIHLHGNIMRNGDSSMTFTGDYSLGKNDDFLDFDVDIKKINLSALQHYFDGLVSNIAGRGSGHLRVTGTAKVPVITGKVLLQKARFTVDYLNTRYSLSDEIIFDEKYIGFNNVILYDSLGNKGVVNGKLYHKFFDDMKFLVHVDASNLLMLDTHAGQNDLFYGHAFATGKVDISGSPDLTQMIIKLRSDKNSQINIPLSTPEEVSKSDFITFEKHDTTTIDKRDKKPSVSGFDIDFEMDVTEDAVIKLIFDEKVGDVIEGQGKGNIKMQLTPDGTFNMFGEYTISKGDYFFTLQNIAGKPFKLVKGSTIRWNGDPYQAEIDIKASYTKAVALHDLLPDDSAAYRRRVPVSVILNLKNNLFSPDVTFDIVVPNVDASTEARIKRYIDTEDEKNKQVMSIIFLNKFQLPSALQGSQSAITGTNTNVASSLTEFLSKQLSDWVSQINKNVNINLSYTPGDIITSEQYNVLVTTQLLQDRLLLNTNVGVNSGRGQSTADGDAIVGEFDIEYIISKDGNFRVKAFNESNANSLINTNQAPYTQGVGLYYRKDFTKFEELLGGKKKEKNITRK